MIFVCVFAIAIFNHFGIEFSCSGTNLGIIFEVLGLILEAWGASWEPLGQSFCIIWDMSFPKRFWIAILEAKIAKSI